MPFPMQMGFILAIFGMGGVVFAPLPMPVARVAALSVAILGIAFVYAVGWLSPGDGFHIDSDTDSEVADES